MIYNGEMVLRESSICCIMLSILHLLSDFKWVTTLLSDSHLINYHSIQLLNCFATPALRRWNVSTSRRAPPRGVLHISRVFSLQSCPNRSQSSIVRGNQKSYSSINKLYIYESFITIVQLLYIKHNFNIIITTDTRYQKTSCYIGKETPGMQSFHSKRFVSVVM